MDDAKRIGDWMVEAALKGVALQSVQATAGTPEESARAAVVALESLRTPPVDMPVEVRPPPITGMKLRDESGKEQTLQFATDFPREMTESIPEKQRIVQKWRSNP